jgi:hypothetical protein
MLAKLEYHIVFGIVLYRVADVILPAILSLDGRGLRACPELVAGSGRK